MKRHLSWRRGASLAELLVVIAFAAIMMTGTTKLLLAMFQAERAGRERQAEISNLDRLFDQFQRDVQAARRQLPQPASAAVPLLRLEQGKDDATGETTVIEYCRKEHGVERVFVQAKQITARETFRLPDSARVSIQIEGNQLTLTVRSVPPGNAEQPGEEWQVHALLRHDRRFAQPENGKDP
jgi:hypothetical protein